MRLKHPEDGRAEGAEFIRSHIIRVTEKAFDDFAGGGADEAANRRMLGLETMRKARSRERSVRRPHHASPSLPLA
jgi:hypothetical protein